jgi:hypothetical protein
MKNPNKKQGSELYDNLKASNPSIRLKWPNSDKYITLNVATMQHWVNASTRTSKIFKSTLIAAHNVEDFNQEKLVQLLYQCVADEDGTPFTDLITIGEFKNLVTGEVLSYLDENQNDLEQDFNIDYHNLEDDSELNTLKEELKKKPVETVTAIYSIFTLRKLTLSLANQVASLQEEISNGCK